MLVNVDVHIKVGNQDFSPSKYRKKNDDDTVTVDGKLRLYYFTKIKVQIQ